MPDRDILDREREALTDYRDGLIGTFTFSELAKSLICYLITELEAARDSASHREGLWRQDLETAATALRERDQALAEVERLRGNQRVEQLEPWLGKCKGSD